MAETTGQSYPRRWDPGIPIKLKGDPTRLDAPTFDPAAAFQVEDPGRPNDPNVGDVPNAAPRAEPVAGVPNNVPQVSTRQAVGLALVDGMSGKLTDEIYGASRASGLPDWAGWFVQPYKVGVARLLYENTIGTPGEVTKAYQAGRDDVRRYQDATYAQRPKTYMASTIGGAAFTAPFLALKPLQAAGYLAQWPRVVRALSAARDAGLAGAVYGAGDGRGAQDTVNKALTGAVVSAGGGAAVGAAAGGQVAGKVLPRVVGASLPQAFSRGTNAADPGATGRMNTFEYLRHLAGDAARRYDEERINNPPTEPAYSGIP